MLTIVASRWENQASTVLEAMIQGCPIVASDTGGTSEIIADEVTGLLARPDDIDDLCQKIMCLLNDPARARQLGENARRFVLERHSVQKLARETVDVYRQAISIAKMRMGYRTGDRLRQISNEIGQTDEDGRTGAQTGRDSE